MKYFVPLLSAPFLVCLLLIVPQAARANVIEPHPTLPPTTGGYVLPTICIARPHTAGICIEDLTLSDFRVKSNVFTANQNVDAASLLTGEFFQDIAGRPGLFEGLLRVIVDVGFEYFDRTGPDEVGTFNAEITELSFSGAFNGHSFQVQLAGTPSTGVTTITPVRPDGPFEVSSFFDVFAELSIDKGPFMPGPERVAVLAAVPEPSPVLLVLTGVAGVALASRLRRGTRDK